MPDKVVTLEIDSTIVEGRDGFVTPGGTFTPGGAAIDLEWNTGVGGKAWLLFEHGIDKYTRCGPGYDPVVEGWAAVDGAVLTLDCETDPAEDMTLRIRAELSRNPEAPTSTSDLASRALTTKYVDWTLTTASYTTGDPIESPDLSDVINEVLENFPPDGRAANILLHITVQSAGGDALLGVDSGEGPDVPFLTLRTHSILNVWRGDAANEAAEITITIDTAGNGELYAIDFHDGRAEYTGTGVDTTSTIATALGSAIEELGIGTVTVDTNEITLTADAEGEPISYTVIETTGNNLMTVAVTNYGQGAKWFNHPLNWSLARPPASHDVVAFESGDAVCEHGLVHLARVSSVASNDITLESGADFVVGQIVRLISDDTLPQPASPTLTEETDLYVTAYDPSDNTLQVALTRGGSAISWSTQGAGNVFIGVRVRHLRAHQAYSGRVGLGIRDDDGRYNTRPRYLQVGFLDPIANTPNLEIGIGTGGGAGRFNVDGGLTLVDAFIADTGGSPDETPACNLKCEHDDFKLAMLAGSCGLAPMEGDHSLFGRLQVFGGSLTLGNDVEPSGDAVIEIYGGGELHGGEMVANRVTIRNRGT